MGDPFLSLFKCGPHALNSPARISTFSRLSKVADVRVDKTVY